MASLSLYEIAGEYKDAMNKLLESDLPEEVIQDTLESLSGDLTVKATNVAFFIRNLEASADAIKSAEKQMAERRKAIENKAERIREYLKTNMQVTGITKIECDYFALTIKKNPPSVHIDDESVIPKELWVYPDPPAAYPDKKHISSLLREGKEVPGVHFEQSERLEIK